MNPSFNGTGVRSDVSRTCDHLGLPIRDVGREYPSFEAGFFHRSFTGCCSGPRLVRHVGLRLSTTAIAGRIASEESAVRKLVGTARAAYEERRPRMDLGCCAQWSCMLAMARLFPAKETELRLFDFRQPCNLIHGQRVCGSRRERISVL